MIIGLTGGYCVGKNAVASILEEWSWTCIDVDHLGHRALEANADAVVDLLGPEILDSGGTPDRTRIGARVFADPELMRRYEAIVHPAMLALLDKALEDADSGRRVCINAAILYRLPQAVLCTRILEVRAPLPLRLARSRARDGLSIRRVLQRIGRQKSLWIAGASYADIVRVVRNDGDLARLRFRVESAVVDLSP